jgi:mono/diheme cytochrome c family protein
MKDETKKKIAERYERELGRGERFWPDSIYKDLLVSLGIFVLLVLLATFIGVPLGPKADPTDTSYIPRPEWYFLFLFKFLALYGQIPLLGKIEWIATVVVPGLAILVLVLLPFIDRGPQRYYGRRVLPIAIMAIMVVAIITLTLIADIPTVSPDGSPFIGIVQAIGGLLIPGLGLALLFLMSFAFRSTPTRSMVWTAGITGALMFGFAGGVLCLASKAAPQAAEATEIPTTLADQIVAGQDLYSINCVECHGDDGKVTEITGVEGLEGKVISPINGTDVLYTLDDPTLEQVIAYGRPDAGMTPFGKAYNPEGLSMNEIGYIVTFMRYAWDDRFEAPPIKPLFPALAEGEVPSYDVHIKPIVKRYCYSCHRPGKTNSNYLMTTYEEMLTTGDNKDQNIIAGDPDSYLLQVIQGNPIMDPQDPAKELIRAMPPTSKLKPEVVDVFMRWIMAGMPQTADEAAALSTTPTPAAGGPVPVEATPTP